MAASERIFFAAPNVGPEELDKVRQTMLNGWIAPVGPELNQFEQLLADKFGFAHVLNVTSGTAALHLAVKLAGIGRGDRVLVGSFTFVAGANAVSYEGGVPVFVDSEKPSWCADPNLIETYLKETLGTSDFPKAVMVTHAFGRAADVSAISTICQKYGVILIEDAAAALGTTIDGRAAGTFGDFGVLSFNGNKIITTSGGGALICKEKHHRDMAKIWAEQSKDAGDHYQHSEIGFNYRLSNVLAGLGIAQLSRFDEFLNSKVAIYETYAAAFGELPWVEGEAKLTGCNYWVSSFLIRPEYLDQIDPAKLITTFEAHNIEARRFWRPIHTQPLYSATLFLGSGVAEDLFARGFSLPSGTGLTAESLERVIEVLRRVQVSK